MRWSPTQATTSSRKNRTVLHRLGALPVLLIGVSLLVFLISRQIPGDPAVVFAGGEFADPEVVEEIRREWGLDRPIPVQYVKYIERLAQGDLGWSTTQRADVSDVLRDRVPATAELGLAALVIGVPLGLALGVRSAKKQGKPIDHVARFLAISGISLPLFWVGLVLAYVFSVRLGWLPFGGRMPAFSNFESRTGIYTIDAIIQGDFGALPDIMRHLALPAITLSIVVAAMVARFARSSFIDVLGENYIRTATAYGISPRTIVWPLAAKNAFLPLVTLIGLLIPALATGSVLVESVFSWPGVGLFLFDALQGRDYAAVQSLTLLTGALYVVVNLLVDLSYVLLDPRLRRS